MSDKETAPKTKPYHPWMIGKLRASPEQCGHYLLAAARDSEKIFLVALRNINEAFAVECTAPAPQPSKCGKYFTCGATGLRVYVCALEKGHEGDCDDSPTRGLVATPQVTPTGRDWRKIADDMNGEYNEGTSEQASPVSFVSGNSYPGPSCTFCGAAMALKCLSCGSTPEPASPTPEKCPTCKSMTRPIRNRILQGICTDPWHSSASTPKGNKKD